MPRSDNSGQRIGAPEVDQMRCSSNASRFYRGASSEPKVMQHKWKFVLKQNMIADTMNEIPQHCLAPFTLHVSSLYLRVCCAGKRLGQHLLHHEGVGGNCDWVPGLHQQSLHIVGQPGHLQ